MQSPCRTFRSSFLVLWRWTTIYCAVLGGLLYLTTWMDGHPMPPDVTTTIALGLGAIFALAVVGFPVYVSADGIRCYNFYGIYHTVSWANMQRLQIRSLFGLRYLVIDASGSGSEIWLPLYLSDMPGFVASVREYAGEQHALVQLLEPYST
jgi:hypothetical protein